MDYQTTITVNVQRALRDLEKLEKVFHANDKVVDKYADEIKALTKEQKLLSDQVNKTADNQLAADKRGQNALAKRIKRRKELAIALSNLMGLQRTEIANIKQTIQISEMESAAVQKVIDKKAKEAAERRKNKALREKEIDSTQRAIASIDKEYAKILKIQKAKTNLNRAVKLNIIDQARANRILSKYTILLNRASIATNKHAAAIKKGHNNMGAFNAALLFQSKLFHLVMLAMSVKTVIGFGMALERTAEKLDLLNKKIEYFSKDKDAFGDLIAKAMEVGTSIEDLGRIVTRFSITTKGAFSTQEMLEWSDALVRSARATGTTTQEMNNALIQLSQSFSAGFLMGDEYRSISENLPMYKIALEEAAKANGTFTGSLKKMSSARLIDTDLMVQGFAELKNMVSEIPGAIDTIDASVQRFQVGWSVFVKSIVSSDFTKSSLNYLAGVFAHLSNDQDALRGLARSFPELISKTEDAANSISTFIDVMFALGKAIGIVVSAFVKLVNIVVENKEVFIVLGVALVTANIAAKLTLMAGGVNLLTLAWVHLIATTSKLPALMALLISPFVAIPAAVAAGTAAISLWVNHTINARNELVEFNNTIFESTDKLKELTDTIRNVNLDNFSLSQVTTAVETSTAAFLRMGSEIIALGAEKDELIKKMERLEITSSEYSKQVLVLNGKIIKLQKGMVILTTNTGQYIIKQKELTKVMNEALLSLEEYVNAIGRNEPPKYLTEYIEGVKLLELEIKKSIKSGVSVNKADEERRRGLVKLRKEFDKAKKAEAEKNKVSISGSSAATKAERERQKAIREANALEKERMNIFSQMFPLDAQYVKDIKDITNALDKQIISEEEANKRLLDKAETLRKNKLCEQYKVETDCIEDLKREYDAIYKASQELNDERKRTSDMVRDNVISQEAANRSIAKFEKALVDAKNGAAELNTEVNKIWEAIGEDLKQNTKGFFADILKGEEDAFENFKERIIDSWADMIADMVVEAMFANFQFNMSGSRGGSAASTQVAMNTGAGGAIPATAGGIKLEDIADSVMKGAEKAYDWFVGTEQVSLYPETAMTSSANSLEAAAANLDVASATTQQSAMLLEQSAEFAASPHATMLAEQTLEFGAAGTEMTAQAFVPNVPTEAMISDGMANGFSTFLAGLTASEIGGMEGVVAGGLVGAGTTALAGAAGLTTAGAAAGGGMAGATAALGAMGPVGWAALAIAVIAGSGILNGDSDVTPDLNVGGNFGGNRSGFDMVTTGAEDNGTFDPAFGYSGTFGSMWASTQHDAFDSEEAAKNFAEGITNQFAQMDDSIAKTLGGEMTNIVADAMGTMDLGVLKAEESEDWVGTLEGHYRNIFGKAMTKASEITGNQDWDIWKSLSGSMASVVYLTTEYVKSTGSLRDLYDEMLDVHSRNADIIAEQMGNWEGVNGVMEMLGVSTYDISISGVEAANALVKAAGGLLELAKLTGYFFETFYTAQEKGAFYSKQYAEKVLEINEKYDTHVSTSTAGYKAWTQVILNNKDASEELVIEMLKLAPVAAQVIQAEQAAIAERKAQVEAYYEAMAAAASFKRTIIDLYLLFDDDTKAKKATLDLQRAMQAFQIVGDAATYTEEELKGWLDHLFTLNLTGEAATLAEQKTQALVTSFFALKDINQELSDEIDKTTENTKEFLDSLNQLGMTDTEKSAIELNKLFKEVDEFGLSIEVLVQRFYEQSGIFDKLFNEDNSYIKMKWEIEKLGFTADMTSSEIIAFTQSLIDAGINVDDSIESIYNLAVATKAVEDEFAETVKASEAFTLSMKELAYQLNGETTLDNTIRQINELLLHFNIVGDHATFTSRDLASLIITLDGMDDETRNAAGDINKLASAMMALDAIIIATQNTIDTTLSDMRMNAIDEEIRLEKLKLDAITESGETALEVYEAQIASNISLKEFLDDLSISDLKNQSPLEKMVESGILFNQAVASGDSDKAMDYATDYLEAAKVMYASTGQYDDIYSDVERNLNSMIKVAVKPGTTVNSDGSPTLSRLEDQKLALEDEYRKAALREQTISLVGALNDMALATNTSLFDVIRDNGLGKGDLDWNLLGTIGTFNDKTMQEIIKLIIEHQLPSAKASEISGIDYERLIVLLTDQGILLKDIVIWDKENSGKTDLSYEKMVEIAIGQKWSTKTLADNYGTTQEAVKKYLVDKLGIPLNKIISWDEKIYYESVNNTTKLKAIGDQMIMETRSPETAKVAENYGGQFTDNEALHFIGDMNVYEGRGTAQLLSLIAANTYTIGLNGIYLNDKMGAANKFVDGVGYIQGTNYVPEDQYAFLHKGEAVIPEKYNLSNYGASNKPIQSNEEIIAELKELKEELQQIKTISAYGFKETIKHEKKSADIAQANSERDRV